MARDMTWSRFRLQTLLLIVTVVGFVSWLGGMKWRRERWRSLISSKYGAFVQVHGNEVSLEFYDAMNLSMLNQVPNVVSIRFKYPSPERLPEGFFNGLDQIKSLSFSGQQLTANDFENISRLLTLNRLSLRNTNVSDSDLGKLREMAKLKHLDLTATQLSDRGIAELSELERLESLQLLGVRSVTDEGLGHLKKLKNLRWLCLRQTSVSPEGVAGLRRAIPKCTIRFEEVVEGLFDP